MKETLEKYLESTGMSNQDVLHIMRMIECSKPDKWTQDRIDLANKMIEFGTKLGNDDLFTMDEVKNIKRLINTVFAPKDDKVSKILAKMRNDVEEKKRREYKYKLRKLYTLENATRGLDQGFYLFSADPNIGKTALLIHLAVNLLMNNEQVKVCMITPDDTITKVTRRFIANLSFQYSDYNPDFATKIDYADSGISDYNHSTGEVFTDKDKETIKLACYDRLQRWVNNGRLTIEAKSKITLDDIEAVADRVGDCVLLVDACYKIKVNGKSLDKDVERAEGLKSISTDRDLTLIGIKDSRKGQTRGSTVKATGGKLSAPIGAGDLKGDASWGYEADFIGTMWCDNEDVIFSIEKNKISSWSGLSRLRFYKDYNAICEVIK